MKCREITVGYSRKKTDWNYGSAEVHFGGTWTLSEDDDLNDCWRLAYLLCKAQVKEGNGTTRPAGGDSTATNAPPLS